MVACRRLPLLTDLGSAFALQVMSVGAAWDVREGEGWCRDVTWLARRRNTYS